MGKVQLGYGKRRLIAEIIKDNWETDKPEDVKLSYNDVLYILQELDDQEGKKYLEKEYSQKRGHFVFREFTKQLLYRNLANYDSMLLLTSDKGCITGDAILEISNEPYQIKLKDALNKENIKVTSYNIRTKQFESKISDGIEYVKTCPIYELQLENGKTLKGTDDHPVLTNKGTYKKIIELTNKDYVITTNGEQKVKRVINKGIDKVYDVVNVNQNHNFVVNGFVVSNTGKCLYIRDNKDFVVSANGELIHPKDAEEIILMNQDMKMQTAKVKKRYNREEKNVYEVKLRSGKSICLTKEHPLYTINGWKELQYLKEKDYIATPRTYEKLKNDEEINIGLVKNIAYLIADKENGDFKKRNHSLKYLVDTGLYEKRLEDKFIPNDIFRIKNEQIAIFLNILYSCDGRVEIGKNTKTVEVNYTSKSELLIKQIQHLLLRFNIISKYNSKNHKENVYYKLMINGKENIINFYDKINFYQEEKRKKLKQLYKESLSIESNTNVDVIPKDVLDKHYTKNFNTKSLRKKGITNHDISLRQFKMIADVKDNKKLNMFANSDIFWDRIEQIKKIDNEENVTVYDLEVDNNNHNFVANDIIIHNSSAAIMLARQWCSLIGIRFDPNKHMAYNNQDVVNKLENSEKFTPIICDEAVRFACLDGETLIKTKKGLIKIKKLVGKKDIEIYSYNQKTKKEEIKKAEKCIKTKYDYVYELETKCGKKIKCTKEHKFLTKDGWKELQELIDKDTLINDLKIKSITKKEKIQTYDIINVKDNNNYIANNFIVHNSSEDWNKKESKELKKKLAQVRTKHLLFILCFPLKISKVDKTYLESFTNYWCLTGDTLITTRDKNNNLEKVTIKDLDKKNTEVLSYNTDKQMYELKPYKKIVKTKKDAEIYEMELENGLTIKCTKEHPFLTKTGWVRLQDLTNLNKILSHSFTSADYRYKYIRVKSIKKLKQREDVYDIVGVQDNHSFVANNMVVHNCDLFGRGIGAIYVKDKNPVNDSWRMKDFKNVGSYTEFTSLQEVEKKLKKHPNFWQIIRFPKPPKWLYNKYLKVREKNVYSEEVLREMVTTEDIHKSLLLLALQDIMMNDTTLNMNRIALHIKTTYDIPITKNSIQNIIVDAKQMVTKIREEKIN